MEEIFRFTLGVAYRSVNCPSYEKERRYVTEKIPCVFRGSNCGPSINYCTNPCYLSHRVFGYLTLLSQLCTLRSLQ
jgi:hypothetical protein